MQRFLSKQTESDYHYVALTNSEKNFPQIMQKYFCIEARDKYSWFKNIFVTFAYIFVSIFQMCRLVAKYKIRGVISTGPGLAIIPCIICRLTGAKVIYFESWSRFYKPSIAGRLVYRLAHLFFVQHKTICDKYPKSIYSGRL
ncbi:PssD/Cps14F family polysaccharide biosynthesis glycosyltransferase [Thalassotalea fusca]